MSLIVPIRVNHLEIAKLVLTRTDPTGGRPEDGEVCTYDVRYYDNLHGYKTSTVQHPYVPENPLPLITAAISALDSQAALG